MLDKAGNLLPGDRFTLAVLLIVNCVGAYQPGLEWDAASKTLTLEAKEGFTDTRAVSGVVPISGHFFDVEPLFLFLQTFFEIAVDMVKKLGLPDATDDPTVRANTLKVLRLRHAPVFGLDRRYTLSGDRELTMEAYRANEPGRYWEYVLEVLGRLTDDAGEFMPAVLDDITNAETRRLLHVPSRFDDNEQIPLKRRALLVALFGDRERVERMLLSRRRAEREAILNAIGAREDLAALVAELKGSWLLPGYSAIALSAQVRQQEQLRDILAATPDWAVAWRATSAVRSRELSLGLKYFVRRIVRSRGGDYTLVDPLL
jgi:hypothetical protein